MGKILTVYGDFVRYLRTLGKRIECPDVLVNNGKFWVGKESIILSVYDNVNSANQSGCIEICFSCYSGRPAYLIIKDAYNTEYYEIEILFAMLISEIRKETVNNFRRLLIQKLGLEEE